jgi:hypothetical protein
MLGWLVNEKGIEPHVSVFDKSARTDATFSRAEFIYDHKRDVCFCPGNQMLTCKGALVNDRATLLYRASKYDCDGCALKPRRCPNAPAQRRRYTIAHELGHFLNPWQEPPNEEGSPVRRKISGRHGAAYRAMLATRLQESQADRFAIEPLAPASRVSPHLREIPDPEQAIAVSTNLDISKEAAARRYVELCARAHRRRLRPRWHCSLHRARPDFPLSLKQETGDYSVSHAFRPPRQCPVS